MNLRNFIKKLNRLEAIYTALFALSLLAGTFYGMINKDYFRCCEDSIGVPEGLPILLVIGFFELAGSLFLALAGFNIFEKLLKIKSRLKPGELFLYGTSLIFIGAVFEYLLLVLVQA
ncbi:MAG: hypothetical protein HY051_01120 [Candidatus Aenigmarchaeota archaeon]|nr:hypothetical protein [Candidatus Aenigmarchaeota archaeon]